MTPNTFSRDTVGALRFLFAGRPIAVTIVVIGNLIPVFGVAALGWNPAHILLLYWAENVILGLLTLPRLLVAGRGLGGVGLALFFTVHYGAFCMGHLVFAIGLIGDFSSSDQGAGATARDVTGLLWAVLAIFLLNLVAQLRDWWLPGRWRDADPKLEMFKPYGRIMVLHLTVLLGAWLVLAVRAPAATILLLCGLKALLELALLALRSLPMRMEPR